MALETSILMSTKKNLGLDEAYDVFDPDVIMHVNTALSTLHQLGVGPEAGFQIEDKTSKWEDFLPASPLLNASKSYVYLRVRMLFDPPTTSYTLDSFDKQIKELEWRINIQAEELQTEGGVS